MVTVQFKTIKKLLQPSSCRFVNFYNRGRNAWSLSGLIVGRQDMSLASSQYIQAVDTFAWGAMQVYQGSR